MKNKGKNISGLSFVLSMLIVTVSFGQDTALVKTNAARQSLTGIVTDAVTKKGIVGVRLSVLNFSAAITDENGHFTINVPSYDAEVIVNADGYETRYVPLKGRTTINVSLLDDDHFSFQQPATLPFGQVIQRKTNAALGVYNANGEWKRPDETVDALLQGLVAGLNSIRRSGAPGVGANLFLRGFNSLYATNKPLIVIDGMLYDANDYGESIIANNYTNQFALINVQDIDNITVIKDASSIYGVKGANGAILITTARAKQQATRIDASVYTGFNIAPENLPVMNAFHYRNYLGEILQGKGLSATEIAALPYMNDDKNNPEFYRYHNLTKWQDKIFENSVSRNLFLKVTGGDNIATYALSVGYMKNEGVVRNTDITRYNTRFNAAFNFSKKLTGSANLSFTYNEQNLKDQGIADKTAPIFVALTKAPFLTDHEVNDKGVFSPNLEDVDVFGVSNPSALIETMQAFNKYYRFQGSFSFQYQIKNSLKAATLFGVIYDKVRENVFIPRKGVADDTLSNAIADSRLGAQVKRLFSVFTDTYLEYAKTFNRKQSVATRLGLRYQHNDAEQDFALGFNSATDQLVSVQNGVTALRQIGGGIGEWNWMNTYFNFDYALSNKYFFSLNAAMDASSRFGKQVTEGITINDIHIFILHYCLRLHLHGLCLQKSLWQILRSISLNGGYLMV
jgi:TonB-dependent SusC/RagA subfamily outer membrane receptor